MPILTIERARRKVREVLKLADGNPQTEDQIQEAIGSLVGRPVPRQEVRDAMEWNHSEAFIRSEYIAEAEKTGWFITASGLAKENIK